MELVMEEQRVIGLVLVEERLNHDETIPVSDPTCRSAGHRGANGLWERREQDGGQTRASTPSRLTLTLFQKKCICLSEGGWKPGLQA